MEFTHDHIKYVTLFISGTTSKILPIIQGVPLLVWDIPKLAIGSGHQHK